MHRPLDTHTHTHTKRSTIFAPMFYHFVRFGPAVGDSVFFFFNSCVDNSSHAHTRRCLCMALFFFIIPCLDILEKKTQIGQGERYDVSERIRCRIFFLLGDFFRVDKYFFFPLFWLKLFFMLTLDGSTISPNFCQVVRRRFFFTTITTTATTTITY